MTKKYIALLVASAVFCLALGFLGGYYTYHIYPQVHAMKVAQQAQATLTNEVRVGVIASIGTNAVVIKVSQGIDARKELLFKSTSNTTVQIGSTIINRPGEMVNLLQWFKVGDTVTVLTKDDVSLATISRPLKPGEQLVETIQ